MLKILTVASLYGVFVIPAPSSSETCFEEFCLTYITDVKNFDDARSWCQMNNSTLIGINDSGIQEVLTQFLKQLKINSLMFINMKLNQRSGNTWFLVNGSNYLGYVYDQNYSAYELYSYLKPYTNGGANEFLVEASNPSALRTNLCNFEGSRCLSNSTSNLLFMNRCYVKYDNESLTWYKARERCIANGGDIVQFQTGPNPWIAPFNTSWLNPSLTYWAGIRWNDWFWKYSGDTNEVIKTYWSDGKPNNVNYACVCVDPKGNPPWTWSDCDCATPRPFVFLKIVPTTTVSTTTSTTTASPTTSPMAIATIAGALSITHASPNKSEGLIVGLVLGLVVILPLTITTVCLIVWIVRLKRRLRENDRNDERATTTAKTSQINQERNAAKTNAQDPDINYQHLKRETMFGPGTSMPLYDQLNHRDNQGYEVPSETT